MIRKGSPPRVGDIGRALGALPHAILFRGVSTSRVLLLGYLDSLEACVRANGCALCQLELTAALRDLACLSCVDCGREPFRRLCRDVAPCGSSHEPRATRTVDAGSPRRPGRR
jgi:hypothetical protein